MAFASVFLIYRFGKPSLPLSVSSSHVFSGPSLLQFNMVCRNLCENLYSKIIFGRSRYEGGKKYCRRCEVYYCHDGVFCLCCGIALRMSPTNKRDKGRLRQSQLRREELDRIIRIIKGAKKLRVDQGTVTYQICVFQTLSFNIKSSL
jgi:hypothetical protein